MSHNKKILCTFIGLITLLIIGGIIYSQKGKNNNSVLTKVSPPWSSPTPQYPKVTSYEVPILMYHYIRDASGESQLGKNLSVWPENFDKQIKGLADNDYVSIKMTDLADPDKKIISQIYFEKKKPIVLTFDDGYADAYTNAFPVLKKYQMIGTFYIIRDYVGRPEYMNQDQINELADAGMEIGSHTLSHPSLEKLSEADQKTQIVDSKESAASFCYPAGKYNDQTVSLVKDAGYTTAVTTNIGIATEKSDLLKLPRVRVEDGSAQVLLDKISYALEKGKN